MTSVVVLHTGPHKTGTTALQQVLKAQATLLSENGVLYPAAGQDGDGHARLGASLMQGDISILQEIARESRGYHTVVLSSEHLSCLDTTGLTALRDAFPGAEFRLSYTLRRLAGLWPSHWVELMKHGQTLGFQGYLDRVFRRDDRPFFAPVLPLRQLERLSGVFGTASLLIGIYDARMAERQDLGPAFIDELLGLGHIAPAFATIPANRRPSDLETAMMYLVNLHGGSRVGHRTKGKAHQLLLDVLRCDEGRQVADLLRIAIDDAGQIVFRSDHPFVRAEQTGVVAGYETILLDDPDTYLAPMETLVPKVEDLRFPPAAAALLTKSFDAALAGESLV